MKLENLFDLELAEAALEERHALTDGQIRELETAVADYNARQNVQYGALFARETREVPS